MLAGRRSLAFALVPLFGCAPSSSSGGSSYYARLGAMADGGPLTEQRRQSILAASVQSLDVGLAGVQFGATMDDVIALWGRPNAIWMQGEGRTQTIIANSHFEFQDNGLVEIDIHSADLPAFSIADGQVAMGEPCPDLTVVFPGARATDRNDDDTREVQLTSGVIVNALSMDGVIISISTERPQGVHAP